MAELNARTALLIAGVALGADLTLRAAWPPSRDFLADPVIEKKLTAHIRTVVREMERESASRREAEALRYRVIELEDQIREIVGPNKGQLSQ